MLRFLSIQRLAIIDALSIEFAPGFNVLTGETGAGKSIVVGAIELLLGARATADLVRDGADSAVVQAVLETKENKELIVRREISANGRSRAFVDDALVTAATLRQITVPLIDLHGQHDHQQLLDGAEHLLALDAFAMASGERARVARAWEALASAEQALAALSMDERERLARLEMARFQLAEITKIAPRAGEDAELGAQREVLRNVDRLATLSEEAYEDLYDAENAVIPRLTKIWRKVDDLAHLDARLVPLIDGRDTVGPILEDLALTLRNYRSDLDASPERLQEVEDRLAAVERLKRKYGPSLDDVIQRQLELEANVALYEHATERKGELESAADGARREYLAAADALSTRRRTAAPGLTARVVGELAGLALERARCEFRLVSVREEPTRWGRAGTDEGELLFSANPGESLRPLARIASGGELARVMLALKTVASTDQPGKTLVFDEVDVGISGRVADTVGRRLRSLGRHFQVISVTHLPQVAAYATSHFRVEKRQSGGRTAVQVSPLGTSERARDIAGLLAGREVTPAVLENARELLALAGESEAGTKGEGESPSRKARRLQ
jgi:DNA repair protein RecN (Recombination protein N)